MRSVTTASIVLSTPAGLMDPVDGDIRVDIAAPDENRSARQRALIGARRSRGADQPGAEPLFNGKITTLDRRNPQARAIGGRLVHGAAETASALDVGLGSIIACRQFVVPMTLPVFV